MKQNDTIIDKTIRVHTLKRRAEQLAKEIDALFQDARDEGVVVEIKPTPNERDVYKALYGGGITHLGLRSVWHSGEVRKTIVPSITIQV